MDALLARAVAAGSVGSVAADGVISRRPPDPSLALPGVLMPLIGGPIRQLPRHSTAGCGSPGSEERIIAEQFLS